MKNKATVTFCGSRFLFGKLYNICKQKKKVLDLRAEMFYKRFSLIGV